VKQFLGGNLLFNLNSVKSKILIFALVATLLPALSLGWLFYTKNAQLLTQKAEQEMRGVSSFAARELELWFKERLYDIRVFSSSYILTENLDLYTMARGAKENTNAARKRDQASQNLQDYLRLIREQFVDIEKLTAYDLGGNVVVQNPPGAGHTLLPEAWRAELEKRGNVVAPVFIDSTTKQAVLPLAVPIRSVQGRLIGVMVAEIVLGSARKLLQRTPLSVDGAVYLLDQTGRMVLSSVNHRLRYEGRLSSADMLYQSPSSLLEYVSFDQQHVVGILTPLPNTGLSLVVEMLSEDVYAEIVRLRDITIFIVVVLVIIVGFIAYLMGLAIVRPLNRLIEGAKEVSNGDLTIELPIEVNDELGFTTKVFNQMVGNLRRGREELERISITDALTGLSNRRYIMEKLEWEMDRYRRNPNPFSLLMIDIDHFKQINDNYGHLAGDLVLSRVGEILRETIRNVDFAGRYGGEEFLIVLDDADQGSGLQSAERIRVRIEDEAFIYEGHSINVTVSIGMSSCMSQKTTGNTLIAEADGALYRAKQQGRNRIVVASDQANVVTPMPTKRPRA